MLGISYVIIFYSFSFGLREIIRVLSIKGGGELWVLSDNEMSFYNLFYAALSIIIGQSICISYWFSNGKQFRKGSLSIRSRLMNEQYVVLLNTVMWLFKLGLLYGIYFGVGLGRSYYVFSLYPNYKYLFVLVIIILYFFGLNTLRQKLHKLRWKWFLLHAIIFFVFSFLLSKVNIIDYKKVNESIQYTNLYENYDLQLPESDCYDQDFNGNNISITYFALDSNQKVVVSFDDLVVSLDMAISAFQYGGCFGRGNDITFHLFIDRRIKMKDVYSYLERMRDYDVLKVHYAVVPKERLFDQRFYTNLFISARTSFAYRDSITIKNENSGKSSYTVIELKQNEANYVELNGRKVSHNNLSEVLYQHYLLDSNFLVHYEVGSELQFGSYISTKESSLVAIQKVWSNKALLIFGESYNTLDEIKQLHLKEMYPHRFTEIAPTNVD